MNIFLIELKAHRKSLIFWCLGMVFMVLGGMNKFATFESMGQSVNDMMDAFPKSVKTILGLGDFDLTKASGFYGILFLYLIIMATIHAVMLGANIIAKEERDKTAEFLFVKPISRESVINAKLLASLVNILILNFVTLISSFIIVNSYSNEKGINGDIALLMFGMLILQLLFLSLGTVVAALSKNPKLAIIISTSILLATFLLSVIIDMTEKIDFLKYFTPFKYFEAKDLMNQGTVQFVYVLISFVLGTVFTFLTYLFYKKRDLTI